MKVGVGGPDLLPYKPGQMNHCYPLIRECAGKVPTGIAVQDGNYQHQNPKTGQRVTISELVGFATRASQGRVHFLVYPGAVLFSEIDTISPGAKVRTRIQLSLAKWAGFATSFAASCFVSHRTSPAALVADPCGHTIKRQMVAFARCLKAGETALQMTLAVEAFHKRLRVFRSFSTRRRLARKP